MAPAKNLPDVFLPRQRSQAFLRPQNHDPAKDTARHYRLILTPLGEVGFVVTSRGVARVWLPHARKGSLRDQILSEFPAARQDRGLMPELTDALRRYFSGEFVEFEVVLDESGRGAFERKVWNVCRQIPYGRTVSYKALAERMGNPAAARAVGGALGRNPFPPLVPCHRVLRGDGALGGYSAPGGLAFKERLLTMERSRAKLLFQ